MENTYLYAYLKIFNKELLDFPLDAVTKKLQVQPTSARKRGEQANPEHPRLYKFTSWLLEFSRETYNSRDVLDPILAAFQSKTAELNQLKHEKLKSI